MRAYRVAFAVLAGAAIVEGCPIDGDCRVTYLSKFTVVSNAVGTVTLPAGALLTPRVTRTVAWDGVRGAAVMCLPSTGTAYSLLLQRFDDQYTSGRRWTGTVLHQLMPILNVLDRCVRPITQHPGWRGGLRWTSSPILYLVDSLIRSAAIGWHRYDVIDPNEVGRYGGEVLSTLGIASGVLGFAFLIVWFSNRLHWVTAGLMPGAVPTGSS